MNRLRLLVMRAHPELSHKERERILVSSFTLGLRDHELVDLTYDGVDHVVGRSRTPRHRRRICTKKRSEQAFVYKLSSRTV